MPVFIPGFAWAIVAVATAFALLIVAVAVKDVAHYLSWGALAIGIPVGIFTLCKIIKDLADKRDHK